MAVILVGEIVNSCDAVGGFTSGNISTDDDFVEGTGAIGQKISNATTEMYTTTLGATAPYDFSSGGGEFGYHIIMWFNTKTPINATTGLRVAVGNGTDRGHWYTMPQSFYKGGFITKVIDTAKDFDNIAAGTWALASNPAQLTNITQVGGVFATTTSIMGNFNNCQLDQFTIGEGLRVDGGTVGSPNSFETVRSSDEDTNFYGWWSSSNGAFVGKGKLLIGPETGSAVSVFSDSAFAVNFADELVAQGFYEIETRGAGTDVEFELCAIGSANSDNVRWNLTIDSSTNSFKDTNSVFTGSDQIQLSSNVGLTGSTIINGNKLLQSGATLEGVTILAAQTISGEAYVECDAPQNISNCSFNYSTGHTLELTTQIPTAITFSNNSFIGGYGADETNEAAIYNNSGKDIIINITNGGGTPSVRNGIGSTTTVTNAVTLSLTNLVDDTEVRIYSSNTINELAGQESVSGGTFEYSYNYVAGTFVDIVIFKESYLFNEPDGRISDFELTSTNTSIPINQQFDRNYINP